MRSLRLLPAKVWHRREKPKQNEFTYRVFYVAHDLTESRRDTPRLFSFDRFNAMSLFAKDHGRRDGSDVRDWVECAFAAAGVEVSEAYGIEMIAHPRVFGYVFDPISFYLLLDERESIRAVLCEVHNTFGDDHSYLVAHDDGRPIEPEEVFAAEKALYVSPFNDMRGSYTFSFARTQERFQADIVYHTEQQPCIRTAVAGEYRPCGSWSILATYLTHPLMTIMIIVRIHWQALRVYLKGVPQKLAERPDETHGGVTTATYRLND